MLEELDQCGFKVIEWDGRCVIFNSHHASLILLRSPAAIVDQEDHVMTVLAGRPQSADWDHTHAHVSALLEQAVHKVHTPHKERQGNFVSLSTGVSFGGGQKVDLQLWVPCCCYP